jgi:hypothetical protein
MLSRSNQYIFFYLTLVYILLAGCMTSSQPFERITSKYSLVRDDIPGVGFHHAVYSRKDVPIASGKFLHVYISGDGSPYVRKGLIAADPTPRHPMVPKLMNIDPNPAILLGRPCYHGYAKTPPCSPHLWTHARYGEEVVASMAEALKRSIPSGRKLVLIGFSGGGVLASLLANRLPEVVAVVTLAANLDIEAWSDYHGYTRLQASLNPAEQQPLAEDVVQLHYVGAKDKRITPELSRSAIHHPGGKLKLLPDTSHDKGWERHWPAILSELEGQLMQLSQTIP